MRRKGWTFLVLGLLVSAGSAVVGEEIPSSAPPIPTATAAQPTGLIGKCTSCIGSIGGMVGGCAKGCCNTALGKLINGAFQPIEMATGGVIPAPCPGPNDPSKGGGAGGGGSAAGGAPGPQAAAEAIKKDQAQAKARCEAVKYLATVPCHYYPEAEAALIQALRTDRSECVRWEAAHALAQGCCCTKKTIAALKLVVSGSQQDGNPSEKSFRVKVEALNALEHCLSMCGNAGQPQRPELPAPMPQPETIPTPLPQPKRPELPLGEDGTGEGTSEVQQANYYEEIERQPSANVIAGARRLVESSKLSTRNNTASAPRRGRSLLEIWRQSDRPDEVVMAAVKEPEGPVRVELPGEGAGQTRGQPTLAPLVPSVSGAEASGYGEALAGKQPVAPQRGPARRARPTSSEDLHETLPYGQANVPAYGGAVNYPAAAAASQSGPTGQEPWPSVSLPPYQGMESLPAGSPGLQALPPLEALPNTVASPGTPTAPGPISTAMGTQGYLYPSTDDRSTFYGQPTQVVQQPEWGNPQRR